MKQKYTITVADVQMNIVTDEDSEAVVAVAGILDRRMREIYLQSGNRCPKTEAALLCALDYCAERNKLQALVNEYEAQLANTETAELEEELAVVKAENEELKKSLEVADKEIRVSKANDELSRDKIGILTEKAMNADAEIKSLREEVEALRAALAAAPVADAPVEVEAVAEEATEEEIEIEIVELPEEPAQEAVEEVAEAPAEVIEEAPKAPVAAIADETEEPAIELQPLRPAADDQLAFDLEKQEEDKQTSIEKEKQKAQKRVRSMFDLITFDNV